MSDKQDADPVEAAKLVSHQGLHDMSEQRFDRLLRENAKLPVFKNADCTLVGDVRDMIAEIRIWRKAAPVLFASYHREKGLREALERAAEQFEFYAKEHHTKANNLAGRGFVADSDASIKKALTNERFAEICRAALSVKERGDG